MLAIKRWPPDHATDPHTPFLTISRRPDRKHERPEPGDLHAVLLRKRQDAGQRKHGPHCMRNLRLPTEGERPEKADGDCKTE